MLYNFQIRLIQCNYDCDKEELQKRFNYIFGFRFNLFAFDVFVYMELTDVMHNLLHFWCQKTCTMML